MRWWGPNQRGDTYKEIHAGRYTKEEAKQICKEANICQSTDHIVNEFCYPAPEDVHDVVEGANKK